MKQVSDVKDLQESIHAWAIRKEWRGPNAKFRPLSVDLILWVSKIAECLEELRKNDDAKHVWFSYTAYVEGVKFENLTRSQYVVLTGEEPDESTGKPEGFGPEAADVMIRILETCEEHGIDLNFEIERKMTYNENREVRHGGKLM